MYTRIRRRLEEYSCHVFEPSLGATAPTYKNCLSSPATLKGSGASLAMFVCAAKHPLTSQDSLDPPNPPSPGGNHNVYIILMSFSEKKAPQFWSKIDQFGKLPYFLQNSVSRAPFWCNVAGSLQPQRGKVSRQFPEQIRDFFLYTHCPSPSGPRSGTGRGTPSIGMRGLHYVYREGRAAISEGRVASPKEGSPRFTRAGASQRSGQASGHRAAIGRKPPLLYW